MTCWQLFEAWVKERNPKPATVDRRRGVFLHMQNHFGMRDIATITELDAVEWKDTLVRPERTGGTVNDVWLGAAKSGFNWAVANKKVSRNPFAGLRVPYARAPQNRDSRSFTMAEALIILAASLAEFPRRLAIHYRNARRWVPWICAYTGMRVQEATQLRGDDIVLVDGIWAFRIRPDAGTLKNNRARTVPIHQHLIDQGFIAFARGYGSQPMFYSAAAQAAQKQSDPTNPQKPLAVKTREHLAKWVREIGVGDPELAPNHAWRHLFKEIADDCGIPEKVSDAITGHAPVNVARQYGKVRLELMARDLAKFPRFSP
jgi:integrase